MLIKTLTVAQTSIDDTRTQESKLQLCYLYLLNQYFLLISQQRAGMLLVYI
jgi:hypothetical protein